MVRILCKGGHLKYADNAGWREDTNISDYDIVFLNLLKLDQQFEEYIEYQEGPVNRDNVFDIIDPERVMDVLEHGGDVYAILPTQAGKRKIPDTDDPPDTFFEKARKEAAGITPVATRANFFDWFPATLMIEDDGGQSVDETSIDSDWDWYFKDSFQWDICFEETKGTKDRGLRYHLKPLVENRYGMQLAGELIHKPFKTRYEDLEIGSVYLLPLLDGWGFEDLAERILEKFHPDVDIETDVEAPNWASEFSTPQQRRLEERISKLEAELDQEQGFRALLYGTGDELEEAVHTAFNTLGFKVEGEKDGRRDGVVTTDERVYVLEIHGTTGGISKHKLRQLKDWKESNESSWEKSVDGLFVVNSQRRMEPGERDVTIPPDLLEYSERNDLHILRSPELFKMISEIQEGGFTKNEVRQKLSSEVEIILD